MHRRRRQVLKVAGREKKAKIIIQMRNLSLLLLWILAAASLGAQPYGLNTATPIGPFLNNILPHTPPNSTATWDVEVAYTNLVFFQPMFLAPYARTNWEVLIEKPGIISMFPNRPDAASSDVLVFLDISSRVFTASDSGMTGIAFHPEFGQPGSTNRGFVYVTYKWRPNPDLGANADYAYIRLSRFKVPDGQMAADPNSEMILMQQLDLQEWHDAGCVIFGLDGFLYFSVGDEGGSSDQYNVTQILNQRLMSGIFRVDVDRNPARSHAIRRQPFHHPSTPAGWPESFTTNYYVPNDNPFVNPDGSVLEEYYALGLRNPYRFSQDPVTGLIWIGDVGQDTREEVDVLTPGGNYQWAYREGIIAGPKSKPDPLIGVESAPLWDYPHDGDDACVIGGYVYRGSQFAQFLAGKYIFVDNSSGRIRAITSDGDTLGSVVELAVIPSGWSEAGVSSCGLDGNGEIYFLKFGGQAAGAIFKLKIITTTVSEPPALLSQIGAFTNLANLTAAPGFHAYAVNTPFWSDGANKQRWMAVPNDGSHDTPGERIVFSPTNEWQCPTGMVFMKHFELPVNDTNAALTRRLETRFLVMDANGGAYGITYKWRADGSDADLLFGGTNADYQITGAGGIIRTQRWSFPSREDCLVCHNANARNVLGVNTHQLNGNLFYPDTGVTDNQLRALGHIGILNSNFVESQLSGYLKSYAVTNTSVSLELRARSYVAANCAQCHRPGGARAYFDARYSIPLGQQNIVQGPVYSFINDTSDRVVVPDDALHSLLHNRANRVGQFQMPPLAKTLVDSNAMQVLADWINSLPSSNTAPVLAAISNRVVVAGKAVTITNSAFDPDVPPQTLIYSLLSAPGGASLGSSNGIFVWRPLISQSPTTNLIQVKVSDDGAPNKAATQSFSITVNRPQQPGLAAALTTQGQFRMTITGDAGPDYSVQGSTNLLNWTNVLTTNSPTPPFLFIEPNTTNYRERFYRVLLGP